MLHVNLMVNTYWKPLVVMQKQNQSTPLKTAVQPQGNRGRPIRKESIALTNVKGNK